MVSYADCDIKKDCENDSETCDKEKVKIYSKLNGLNQNDPNLIQVLRDDILLKPKRGKLNLDRPPSPQNLRAQYGQPYMVEDILKKYKIWKKIKKRKQQGFFIEAGAVDGEYLSNTLFFEMKYSWTGLLVEPNPSSLKALYKKHRKSYILPHCLSTKPEVEMVNFDVSDVLSGIIVEGKVKPSRVDDPNPGRSDKKYERKIQVSYKCEVLFSNMKAI